MKNKLDFESVSRAYLRINAQSVGKQEAEPAGIQVGTGANHPVGGQARDLPGAVREDVHGV